MGTPAASPSNAKTSSQFERNMRLMRELGVEFYDAVPQDQLLTFMLPIYETPRRILAWVHERTLCYPSSSTFCMDKTGNALQQKDCLRSLNETARQFAEKHGIEPVVLSKSAISRGFAHLKKWGLVRFDDRQGRIYLCGKVTPSPDAIKLSDEKSISPALREVLDLCPVDERSEIVQRLHDRQTQLKEAVAAAVRTVRQEHRQAEDEFLAEHGIAKVPGGKKYTRLHVHATPRTENQQITVDESRVHVTREPKLPRASLAGSAPAGGDELHVHATSERKISTENQPPAATAEASAATDELHERSTDRSKLVSSGSVAGAPANGEELNVHATTKISTDEKAPEHPMAAVPTFKEWHQLYPVQRLDAQKADQIFKALGDFDKIKATDGLRAHLVCERWRRTPDYIPFASRFLSERFYDYAPAPYFELKNGNSVPTQHRSHDPAPPFTAEQLRNFLLSNARAYAVGGFWEVAEVLESLAADSERQISNLESLEGLLASMQDKILNQLKDANTDEQLSELERSLEDALKSHRNMSKEQIEALRRQFLEHRLIDDAGLPRLSLFYMQ